MTRQFDVFAARTASANRPYLIVLQHDAVDDTGTLAVAPCASAASAPRGRRLTPQVEIEGRLYSVLVPEIAAVARSSVQGRVVCNLAADRDLFTGAIDLLFTGI